jgi:hypothetical protein
MYSCEVVVVRGCEVVVVGAARSQSATPLLRHHRAIIRRWLSL